MVCWRAVYHTARKILSCNCQVCRGAIDHGDVYYKWVGWVEGMGFYWFTRHEACRW